MQDSISAQTPNQTNKQIAINPILLTLFSLDFFNVIYQGGEYQKRFRQLVSAKVVACLAVITLIKACKFTHQLVYIGKFFFTLSGPTGSLNTKVLFKEYKLFAYVYQLL